MEKLSEDKTQPVHTCHSLHVLESSTEGVFGGSEIYCHRKRGQIDHAPISGDVTGAGPYFGAGSGYCGGFAV